MLMFAHGHLLTCRGDVIDADHFDKTQSSVVRRLAITLQIPAEIELWLITVTGIEPHRLRLTEAGGEKQPLISRL